MYNWNIFENSEYCPNYESAMKYFEMYFNTNNQEYKRKSFEFTTTCLLSEFSALSKENQNNILTVYSYVR